MPRPLELSPCVRAGASDRLARAIRRMIESLVISAMEAHRARDRFEIEPWRVAEIDEIERDLAAALRGGGIR